MEIAVWIGLAALILGVVLLNRIDDRQRRNNVQLQNVNAALDQIYRHLADQQNGANESTANAVEELQRFLEWEFKAHAEHKTALLTIMKQIESNLDSLRSDIEQRHQTVESIEQHAQALDQHFNPSHDDDLPPYITGR